MGSAGNPSFNDGLKNDLTLPTLFGVMMDKKDYIDLLMLLSALEAWSFSAQTPVPDYLHENLSDKVDMLKKRILEDV